MMTKEVRTFCFDEELQIQAYRFIGVFQPFPNHFHDHYMIGYMEDGYRIMECRNQEYRLKPMDITLLNPRDNHSCLPDGQSKMNYYGLAVPPEAMKRFVKDLTGSESLPIFTQPAITDDEVYCYLVQLNEMIMAESREFEKEELFLCMLSFLLEKYTKSAEVALQARENEIEVVCTYMKDHYEEHISLDHLCSIASLSKSTLLRSFTKAKGITPYRYLETIRVNKAKALLEDGVSPIDAAMATGFSDQSHFNRFFTMFIGVSPGVYRDMFKERG